MHFQRRFIGARENLINANITQLKWIMSVLVVTQGLKYLRINILIHIRKLF